MNKVSRYSPKLKFQVVLESFDPSKTPGQIAKVYRVHPNSVGLWKKIFLERGPEIFARDGTVAEYERRIAELEQWSEDHLLGCLGRRRWSSRF